MSLAAPTGDSTSLRVAAIQHDIVWEDPSANFDRLAPRIAEAAGHGARLITLTEMFSNGFSMNSVEIAEDPDGPSTTFLREQAAATGAWVCGSIPIREPGDALPHNRLVLAAPDGSQHRYAKIHRFSFAGEHEHYLAGDQPLTVTIDGVRVSLFVCFDLRFAPTFWTVAPDTDLYVVIANWPASRAAHWSALAKARAIENQAHLLAVNRVGNGGGLAYSGDSVILDPLGDVLAAAEPDAEVTLYADIDPELVDDIRTRFPFLTDRL